MDLGCPVRIRLGMSLYSRSRRPVALVAAYAIALQALLSAFVLPAVAVAGAGPVLAICASSASDPAGGPASPALPQHHDACPACLAGHCAAGSGCDRAGNLVSWPRAVPVRIAAAQATLPPPARREQTHNPRAPPAA